MKSIRSLTSRCSNRGIRFRPQHEVLKRCASTMSIPVESDESQSPVATLVYSSLSNDKNGELLDYARGWAWQQTLLSRRLELRRRHRRKVPSAAVAAPTKTRSINQNEAASAVDDSDCVLMFEHPPVYTLGRGADETHLTFLQEQQQQRQEQKSTMCQDARTRLARSSRGRQSARLTIDQTLDRQLLTRPLHEAVDMLSDVCTPVMAPNGVPIYRVERGGEVTFHGPGQLVVYPLLDLTRPPLIQDLHWYLRMIEEVVLSTLNDYGIDGRRCGQHTGVWVDDSKVAAVGVTSSRWITTHGFAINVDPDLSYFDTSNILPCGIEGKGVTSMKQIWKDRGQSLESMPALEQVAATVLHNLQLVFDIELQESPISLN